MTNETNNFALVQALAAVGSLKSVASLLTDRDSARRVYDEAMSAAAKISQKHNFNLTKEKDVFGLKK